MGLGHTCGSSRAGEAYKVLGADVGCEYRSSYRYPCRGAAIQEVISGSQLLLTEHIPDDPNHAREEQGYDYPVPGL